MKLNQTLLFLLSFVTVIHALALPRPFDVFASTASDLFKRKGGGGGGGKGGSSGGSSSGGTSSGGTSSGGSSSGGRTGSSGGTTGGTPNSGGRAASGAGSGVAPSRYGGANGGTYYGGGTTVPYTAGTRSTGGLGFGLLGGALLATAFAGPWLYGAYAYNYPGTYTYHNNTSNMNNTLPMECLCAQYSECGCDANNNTDYLNSVANNASIARVSNINGTQTLVINGTLPNGTVAASAAPPGLRGGLLEMSGWWVVIGGVVYTMWLM